MKNHVVPDLLRAEMKEFELSVAEVFRGIFGKPADGAGESEEVSDLRIENDFNVSILFLGSAFGEFIISMPRRTAEFLVGPLNGGTPTTDEDVRDALCESLNMVAGGRLKALSRTYPKMTITTPKTFSGSMRYPSVKAYRSVMHFAGNPVVLGFYLDQMRLDIAESYRDSMGQLASANQELLKANERLKLQQMQLVHSEKMASLGTMAAGVAHEINNPLSFVVSNSEVLSSYLHAFQELFSAYQRLVFSISERRTKDAKAELSKVLSLQEEKDIPYLLEDTQNLLTESRSGLDRIRGIVNGLKLFSRVDDAGVREVDLNAEISNTLQLISNELKYKCEVSFSPGDLPAIECVPGELGQVFVNLFVNAAHAMPETDGRLTISTCQEGETAKIEVSDNGCGIAPENLGKIFDPFFTTKPVGQGTGLGLAVSHSIIANHRGTIEATSEVGKGTKFTVLLPIKSQREVKVAA